MRREDFTKDMWGELVRTADGQDAFRPWNLPPDMSLTWSLAARLERATRALAQLAGAAQHLINPQLLIRPFVRREAVLSSAIEGTHTTLSDLVIDEAEADILPPPHLRPPDDIREVRNYVSALDYGIERLKSLPPSLRLIRELHERLMLGVRGNHAAPGEFRRSQVHIGGTHDIRTATYVPPPVPEMTQALDAFERWLHTTCDYPALIRLAMAHYQFEAIHPFLDGNGRVGRLLITLLMSYEKLMPEPLLYLSAYFERYRREYYDCLLAVSQRGEWAAWLEFFLDGVTQQAEDAEARSRGLADLLKEYRDQITNARSSALAIRLVEHLFIHPAVTVSAVASLLQVTYPAAQHTVDKLVKAGILQEITGRRRDRIYFARGIIDAVDKPLIDER